MCAAALTGLILQEYATSIGASYFETSAETGQNVRRAFVDLATTHLRQLMATRMYTDESELNRCKLLP